MRVLLALLLLCLPGAPLADVWARVVPGDAMYNPELDMAALVRPDGSFAVVICDPDGPGALVGLGFIAEGYADRLTSTLRIGGGRVSTRDVAVPELIWRGNALDGAVTYLFPISPAEVEMFKAGQSWRVQVGDAALDFPLIGSRAAISAAEAAKAARAAILAPALQGE
ncbi:MAG: hypothetical protein AAGF60_15270 [Pseudomonadota bacterium]